MTKLLTTYEVSDLLGVPARTLDQWAYLRVGPTFVKVGRYRRYRLSDIEAYIAERAIVTKAQGQ